MRDISLLIVILGAILVSVGSLNPKSLDNSDYDEPVRMASESLVVKSYKDEESSTASTTTSQKDRFEEYQVYQGVMGRPGVDFPVYSSIPATNFSCRKVKKSGYYADLATNCQVFHICDGNRKISFLCPNGTIFRQSHLICDWWFRVDCGKSLELYEESAEQLAADQKVYRSRSEERERRRKQGKASTTTADDEGEVTSSEVYALDEPFHIKGRKQSEQARNGFSTARPTVTRHEERKGERHSKKVADSGKFYEYTEGGEKSSNQNSRYKQTENKAKNRQEVIQNYSTPQPVTKVSFVSTRKFSQTTPSHGTTGQNSRQEVQNSVSFVNNKENFQQAESGSLIEDLTSREKNKFGYVNSRGSEQNSNYNVEINNNAYTHSQKITQTSTESYKNVQQTNKYIYNNQRESQNADVNNRGNDGFFYNSKQSDSNQPTSYSQIGHEESTKTNPTINFSNREQYNNFAFKNNQNNENRATDFSRTKTNEFAYNHQLKNNETQQNINKQKDANIYYNINVKTQEKVAEISNTERSNNFAFNDQRINVNSNTGSRNYETTQNFVSKGVDISSNVDSTDYTTEYVNYESKRTNPIERHETVTPTTNSKKTQSSRYRSSTVPYEEQEKQFFAETASFASNRGGKSYSDYQNQYNTFIKQQNVPTQNTFKTTFQQTYEPTQETFSSPAPNTNPPFYNQNFNQPSSTANVYVTTTLRPPKQNSQKVTIFPSTNPQTTVTSRVWQTTTFQPFTETIAESEKFTVDDIYFTTSTPGKEVEFVTEPNAYGTPKRESEIQTEFENLSTTPRPEVDITLQEVNINKGTPQVYSTNGNFEDSIRDGLEVPPSSGPNAIRSFALYFATTNNNSSSNSLEEGKTTFYLPVANEGEFSTTLTPFEIKKKEVVKQVDELVQRSSINVTDHDVDHSKDSLPSSLTSHTKDSYSALFPETTENTTNGNAATTKEDNFSTSTDFETTAFESFTEEPYKINKELTKNDLDGSQSRGLVEPDPHSNDGHKKVSPDLRELAQVFTKALSAYLDDPEAFRRVLSEIRPTEPTTDFEVSSSNPIEYPSATQEDDEVLDFSDVTKASYKKKSSTTVFRETTTEFFTDTAPTTNVNDVENFVLPVNHTSWATNIELTAPLFESLDQSQSSYYTAPPFIGTTNAIAEEINNEFSGFDKLNDSNDTADSYLPIRGSVDDPSLPRYGGFQNNTKSTKYSPYGAELTSTTYIPYGADLTTTAVPNTAATNTNVYVATTFNPVNVTSFFSHFSKNETEEGEIQLAKELNNLVLLQKFTTPRGIQKETPTSESRLSTAYFEPPKEENHVQSDNNESLEQNNRGGKSLHFPESDVNSNYFEPNPKEINLELSPPASTPRGFLITYSLGSTSRSEPATYLPKATTAQNIQPTTYSPGKTTVPHFATETVPSTFRIDLDNFSDSSSRSVTEYFTTIAPTTISFSRSTKPIERLAELQETLMFNTNNLTIQQKDQARISVEEIMDTMNMTDSTANTLMKVMEMAAKNETYRRLVLLLVNDKSGKNKTVEEARLSLLKALLTPVINPHQSRTIVPIVETARLAQEEPRYKTGVRTGKSISEANRNHLTTTTVTPTTQRRVPGKNIRKVKSSRELTRAESSYSKSGLGNLGVIRRTIENSKNKQVKLNSLDDAILNSDSRAVELLRSLYSLAARWG